MCGSHRDLRLVCDIEYVTRRKRRTNALFSSPFYSCLSLFEILLTTCMWCWALSTTAGGLETTVAAQATHHRFLSIASYWRVGDVIHFLIVLYFVSFQLLLLLFCVIVASRSWNHHYGTAPSLLLNVFSRQTNGTNKRPITPTSEEKKRIEQVIVRVQNGRNQSESP